MADEKIYEKLVISDAEYKTILTDKYKEREPYKRIKPGALHAFIPGTINEIYVKVGDKVKVGDQLLILEAMKMRNRVESPIDGVVKELNVKLNQVVAKNELLILIK